jgi:hypothetical protein
MPQWDGTERRVTPDRRMDERRQSMRYTVGTLIVIDNVTWIDTEGTDRRRLIRRRDDRERIARLIIEGLET